MYTGQPKPDMCSQFGRAFFFIQPRSNANFKQKQIMAQHQNNRDCRVARCNLGQISATYFGDTTNDIRQNISCLLEPETRPAP